MFIIVSNSPREIYINKSTIPKYQSYTYPNQNFKNSIWYILQTWNRYYFSSCFQTSSIFRFAFQVNKGLHSFLNVWCLIVKDNIRHILLVEVYQCKCQELNRYVKQCWSNQIFKNDELTETLKAPKNQIYANTLSSEALRCMFVWRQNNVGIPSRDTTLGTRLGHYGKLLSLRLVFIYVSRSRLQK